MTLARTDRDTARLHNRLGAWEGTEGTGGEGPGRTCTCPAPARISAMADHHRAHDPNLARWCALRHPPCTTRRHPSTRPVKKSDTLEGYLLTPSNRIGVYFLSLPHPRFWGHTGRLFFTPQWACGAHMTEHPPSRAYWDPKIYPNLTMAWDTPRYHLSGPTFFSRPMHCCFCGTPRLGLGAMRPHLL